MKTSERPSKQVQVRDSLHQHLHLYALAASAAGVSMLALAQSSEAEIIYTPANQYIGYFYYLDLTGDGTKDFVLVNRSNNQGSFAQGEAAIGAFQTGNGVVQGYIGRSNRSFAAALKAGYSIGPSGNFVSSGYMAVASRNWNRSYKRKRCSGQFQYPHDHFLGLKFMISGEVHYGWARLDVKCSEGTVTALLTGYAYETIPNQGLKAGQKKEKLENERWNEPVQPAPPSVPAPTSATLGMLAKGAQALSIWRSE